jgi:3-oxoacyl-[acyl-carrier protein] reductase
MKSNRLTGRTALVTGSTSGIGRGIAARLAEEGAHVVVSGRDAGRGAEAVAAIRAAGGAADFVAADLGASADGARALATEATAALGGRIDILVNNAGVYPVGPTADLSDADVDALLGVNIRAPHALVGAIAPAMAQRGEGNIINIGSWLTTSGFGAGALYSATKSAIEQLSRSWASEYGAAGVRVNAISPGVIGTEGNASSQTILEQMVARTPGGRIGLPSEIGDAAVFLASDEAAYVHGATIAIDGGAGGTYPA